MKILWRNLATAAHRYSTIGIQLLDNPEKVNEIEIRIKDVGNYLEKMLQEWRAQHIGALPLRDVLAALRSNVIRHTALALKLEQDWTKKELRKFNSETCILFIMTLSISR